MVFRKEIRDWENRDLVKGAILTYHFHTPSVPSNSLYVCLDLPAVETPHERSVKLPEEAISQIPMEIMNRISQLCDENQIELGIMDYEFDIITSKSSRLYRNAPAEEIIRFASVGTKIAFDLLDMMEKGEITLRTRRELADIILTRLRQELGNNYFWLREAFHFVCNPMLLKDSYFWL